MNNTDTIVAQVTPQGKSGVSILRVSGKNASIVCIKILKKMLQPRFVEYLNFYNNNNILDKGLGIWFPSPNSFTGEDVLELQGHGNPILIDLILKTILQVQGVRLADPGEFSKRAFLNGKIDLVQAEAVADLINAESKQLIYAALNSMQGHFSLNIKQIVEKIISIRTYIESMINFEEVSAIIFEKRIIYKLKSIMSLLKKTIVIADQGSILKDGIKITIIGLPNAGKSSLMNALACKDISIVTDIKGTTRDVIQENINIKGHLFVFSDTAGLRKTDNKIEVIGIKKAWEEVHQSDHVLYVVDVSKKYKDLHKEILKNIPSGITYTVILNKCDIMGYPVRLKVINKINYIYLSAKKNIGVNFLRNYLKSKFIDCKNKVQIKGIFSARSRHLVHLNDCFSELTKGKKVWKKTKSLELLAEHIRRSQMFLDNITGRFTSEDLLNHIFSSFCIGK